MEKKLRLSVRAKLFLSHLLAVLITAGGIGVYFYQSASESLMRGVQERLQASAALISQSLDADEVRPIRDASSVNSLDYVLVLEKLRTLRRMNPDIAFLYIMRLEGEKVFFVLDSDETAEQALPGKEYTSVVPSLLKGFTAMFVDDQIYTDQWGSFLSGYAPLKNGKGQYLVGIDMRADIIQHKYRNLRMSALTSLVTAIVLAFILANFLATRFMAPIYLAIAHCSSIAAGRLNERIKMRTNDELDLLIDAFNHVSGTLDMAEQKTKEAFSSLSQAKDELEIRVRQRTADLNEVNNRLSQEVAERLLAQKALEEAATVDPLTRLLNRRALQERFSLEMSRTHRQHVSFALILVDLDHFKRANDDYGHAAGDSLLVETGVRMKSMLRAQDLVTRWGGEEFMILLPDTNLEGGRDVAEKIRRRIAEFSYFFEGREILLTASFGVVEFRPGVDLDWLTSEVDKALYRAKKLGRNRVECA